MVAKTTGGLIFANYVRALRQLRVTKTILKMAEEKSLNFLEEIVEEDLKGGKYKHIVTRFPTGAEWIFTYWSCYQHLPQFWLDKEIRRDILIFALTTRTR
jgi:hypothetical protein